MSSLSAFNWLQSSLGIDITGEWSGLVNLNVGGVTFCCHRKTFKAYADTSILCKMALTNDRNVPRSEDGSIIIDRDPETFRHVLNFLRANGQRLVLPDEFDEWDLLLEDSRIYELPKLTDAIRSNGKYQRRCFVQSLPSGVMLRWFEGQGEDRRKTTAADEKSTNKKEAQQNQQQQPQEAELPCCLDRIEIFPPLPSLEVNSRTGFLAFQGRSVSSVDEAVAILLTTYEMRVDVWNKEIIDDKQSKAHTIFLTGKR